MSNIPLKFQFTLLPLPSSLLRLLLRRTTTVPILRRATSIPFSRLTSTIIIRCPSAISIPRLTSTIPNPTTPLLHLNLHIHHSNPTVHLPPTSYDQPSQFPEKATTKSFNGSKFFLWLSSNSIWRICQWKRWWDRRSKGWWEEVGFVVVVGLRGKCDGWRGIGGRWQRLRWKRWMMLVVVMVVEENE